MHRIKEFISQLINFGLFILGYKKIHEVDGLWLQ